MLRKLALVGATVGVATLVVLSAVAYAERGGNGNGKGGKGSITVEDGVFGETTMATVNPGGTWVYAECFQDGERVYAQYVEADENNEAMLTLGPTPSWTGGDAECVAEEGEWTKNGRWRVLASTKFSVTG